jgi:dipeptidyl-peptidase 4
MPSIHTPRRCLTLLLSVLAALAWNAAAQDLRTTAERSGFTQTATHEEVLELCRALDRASDRVHLTSLGHSGEGRDLPLLIIADPPVTAPEQADRRLVTLLIGNIHAGEVCGKEALLMLARELATDDPDGLLEGQIVLIAPIYNADGNERFSPDNRPGQDGPERMGVRHNAQNLDLNRDFIKAEAPETRALLRAFRAWDPDIFVDTHTTNGSHHRYVLTYAGPKHPGGDAATLEYVRDTMLPRIGRAALDRHGLETFVYGNFADDHTRWTTFPASPRYSTNYAGMRGTIGILTEAYSYAPFEARVLATLDFCRAILADAGAHREEIASLRRAARTRARAPQDEPTPLRTAPVPLPDRRTVKGFVEVEENGRRIPTEQHQDYEVEVLDDFVATATAPRPWAYVLPADRPDIAELLQRHGLRVETIREDVSAEAEVYRYDEVHLAEREFQGHRLATVTVAAEQASVRIDAGAFLVRTAQELGDLAPAMLEPEAEDSLVTWNFFDEGLEAGAEYPVVRLTGPLPLLTTDLPPLEEDRAEPRRLTFEILQDRRQRPDFSGSPMRSVEWRDGEHYAVSRGNERWLVEAATGRYLEQVERTDDRSALDAAISALPGIDRRTAGRVRLSDRAAGVGLFEHAGDLYAAALDGAWARRLTSDPGREELASLSPDGTYAAFVRDHDLYTVETATGLERRLTTNGSEKIRNGKHAWVYFEEIFGRSWKGYWWSPQSDAIAYYETDSTDVDTFTIIDDAVEPQRIEVTEYPKPGRPNPEVRLGVVPAAGGEPAFIDLSAYTAGATVVSSLGWWPDGSKVHFTIQDRAQTWLDLCTADPSGGKPTRLLRDRTEAWIKSPSIFRILKDGSLLLSSERSGWQHLYRYNPDGTLRNRVTEGPWDVRNIEHLDEDSGRLLFRCTADSPTGLGLYAVNLDGTGLQRITTEPGTHSVSVSPGAKLIADFWSSAEHPDRAALLDDQGNHLRTLDLNPVNELLEWDLGRMETVRVPTSRTQPGPQGEEPVFLEAMLFYPPDFDPARRYPLWFLTYAGPQAPTVRDTWSGARPNERMLTASGFIVCRADPYSASAKGARSAWTAYRRLGVPEMEDIDELMRWLKEKPYVDPERIGMSGFSYGGFMTAYAMTHSDHFAAGIAGGSVTSWYDYDTIYTERYMDTPQENPEGYAATNVVDAAENLHGRILIVHGMMDDNVHVQNATKLVRALQQADKDFEMMYYPSFRHGIWMNHYRRLTYDFQMRLVEQGEGERPSEQGSILHQPRAENDDDAREPGRRRPVPERPETSGRR